jgi:mutator protein MutT
MKPVEHFKFCPRCGQPNVENAVHSLHCPACGFVYYFNPAIAAAAFIRNPSGHILLIRRAKAPAKGKLALPGGFIDIGETAETAVQREIREEVSIEITNLRYLCSQLNDYHYKDVTYPVLDLFFVANARAHATPSALDGVESYLWAEASKVNPEEIAFPSIRAALADYLRITEE